MGEDHVAQKTTFVRGRFAGGEPALHCILVHGTFAPDADWTHEGSFLARSLTQLDPGGVLVSRFIWSGRNRHAERTLAARTLWACLQSECEGHPGTRVLLIGHSHGGGVVAHAAGGIPKGLRAGVVCLGTPFFRVRPRSTTTLFWALVGVWWAAYGLLGSALLGLLALFGAWLYSAVLGQFTAWFYSLWPPLAALGKTMGAGGGTLGVLFPAVASALILRVAFGDGRPAGQAEALSRWQQMAPQPVRTLCIWFGPDEAYWGLRAVRWISEWVHPVIAGLTRYVVPVAMCVAAPVGAWLAWREGLAIRPELSKVTASMMMLRMVGYVGSALCSVPLALWAAASLLAIPTRRAVGAHQISDHLWLDIHVARTPTLGSDLLEAREFPLTERGVLASLLSIVPIASGPLVHSRLYTDERTPMEIFNWYRRGMGNAT